MSLKDFRILNRLGDGTYSSVWLAKRISDGQNYAIKKVRLTTLSEKEKLNSLNEVRLLASINHPCIIGFKEVFFEDDQTLCIVMEFAGGGDLHDMIMKQKKNQSFMNEKDVWRYSIQLILGLKTLHDRKILHRDLKCANVFLSKDHSQAKLGDLNVSKVAKNELVYTQTGTPYYASPEVWRDEPYDMKSDVWSLGCVIYEICALRPPFRANDMPGLFKKVQRGVYEKIPQQYSSDLATLVALCLQVSVNKRYTCDQLLKHPAIKRNSQGLLNEMEENEYAPELLNTIRLPKNVKNMRELKLRLPKSNYEKQVKSVDYTSNHSSRFGPNNQDPEFFEQLDLQSAVNNTERDTSNTTTAAKRSQSKDVQKYSHQSEYQNTEIMKSNPTVEDTNVRRVRDILGGGEKNVGMLKRLNLEERKGSKERENINYGMKRHTSEAAIATKGVKADYHRLPVNKLHENRFHALEKRAQQLIAKYHQDVQVAEKKQQITQRSTPNIRSKRESKENLFDKQKNDYEGDILPLQHKLEIYDRHNIAPLRKHDYHYKRNGSLSYNRQRGLQASLNSTPSKSLIDKSQQKDNPKPVWWG